MLTRGTRKANKKSFEVQGRKDKMDYLQKSARISELQVFSKRQQELTIFHKIIKSINVFIMPNTRCLDDLGRHF